MLQIQTAHLILAITATAFIVGGCGSSAAPAEIPPTPEPVLKLDVVQGRQGIDLSRHPLIELTDDDIQVSSTYYSDGSKENLIDDNPDTSWHVELPRETNEAWVSFDLITERRLEALALMPRQDFPDQLWTGDAATLQGSNDKQQWVPLIRLQIDLPELNDRDWVVFHLPDNIPPYRYYRIFITDPNFLSLGELRVFGEGGALAVEVQLNT